MACRCLRLWFRGQLVRSDWPEPLFKRVTFQRLQRIQGLWKMHDDVSRGRSIIWKIKKKKNTGMWLPRRIFQTRPDNFILAAMLKQKPTSNLQNCTVLASPPECNNACWGIFSDSVNGLIYAFNPDHCQSIDRFNVCSSVGHLRATLPQLALA